MTDGCSAKRNVADSGHSEISLVRHAKKLIHYA